MGITACLQWDVQVTTNSATGQSGREGDMPAGAVCLPACDLFYNIIEYFASVITPPTAQESGGVGGILCHWRVLKVFWQPLQLTLFYPATTPGFGAVKRAAAASDWQATRELLRT